jgi:ABC-type taurine transport system substrate-binding protein
LREECRLIPSLSAWNVDETQVDSLKTTPPNIIVAAGTKPGTVTVPEKR